MAFLAPRGPLTALPAMGLLQLGASCQGDPTSVAGGIGLAAALLSIGIPAGIWFIAMRPWKPKTRITYAARFALWPGLLFSTQLGGPLARLMAGHESRYLMGFGQSLGAVLLLSLVAAPFAFGAGYLIAKARFPAKAPDSPNPRKLDSAPTTSPCPEAAVSSPESLHRDIRRRRWQLPSVVSTGQQPGKASGAVPPGDTNADAPAIPPPRSFGARSILVALGLIVIVVLGVLLVGNLDGRPSGRHALRRGDLEQVAMPRLPHTTTLPLSGTQVTNFPFLEPMRPPNYPISRVWWSEEDGCGALFPEAPKRIVLANSVKAVGYQGPIDLGLDGTAVANVTVQDLDHNAAARVGDAAFLGMCHDAFVASIGASSADLKRQDGTHACGGAMLSYSVDWDGPDGSKLTSAGFWVVNAGKVYRAGVMFHRDIGVESKRIARHFPTTLTLAGTMGQSPKAAGTGDAYYAFLPSAKGPDFKRFRHNILGFEIDMPSSWVFGIVGTPPAAVALLYPEGLNTAKIGPDWKTIELGEIPVPGVSVEDAMGFVLKGMRSKHANLRMVSEAAATRVGDRPAVTATIAWTSNAGFVVTERLYVVQFGKAPRTVAVRSARPDPGEDLTTGDAVIQTFVPLQPTHR